MGDRNLKQIIELIEQPGNDSCADCNSRDLEYGSYNLGIFLCTNCAMCHQKIGTHISKVKSLRLANWNDDQADLMKLLGNVEAKKKYEKHVPSYYRRPSSQDPCVLLEQWIRAKYERLEFIHVDKQKYNKSSMEDHLLVKKKRDDNEYSPKHFVLSKDNGSLSIFSKEDAKEAKVSVLVTKLNICLAPQKTNEKNSMQLSFIEDGMTKHVFVKHDQGEILIDWYMAIRHAKLLALCRGYPTVNEKELLPYLTQDFEMEGWVSKTGPNENDAYRKRWLTIDNRKLMYHLSPLDETPRGEIFLGNKSEGYNVREGATVGNKEMGFVFSLITPERTYVFSVSTAGERQKWMFVIDKVLDIPLGPQDIQCRAQLDPSKKRASRHSWFHF